MHFSEFIKTFIQKLNNPLPGETSHEKFYHQARILSKLKPDEKTRKSAVLILFYPDENKIKVPLILRPDYDGTHGGQMALPGGKVEPFDENLKRTAIRETQEEIGIKALDVNIIGSVTEVFIPVSNFMVYPVIGYLDYKPVFFPDPKEVDKIFEVDFTDFLKEENIAMSTVSVRGTEMSVPGFAIQEQWVWGATALIFNEIVDIWKN
jgi:8-oxo-dGTP pyrophosphatase MutT (NUDIX family)